MRERALIHVAGPANVGKTTFIERLLDAEAAFAICVRAEHDPKLREDQVSAPKTHKELRRYSEAGAGSVALYRFGPRDADAFFTSDFMQDYSEAVFIEGDQPLDYIDLSVFVASPLAPGRSLLRRVRRDRKTAHEASIAQMESALDDPEALIRLIGGSLGEPFVSMALKRPELFEDVRQSMSSKLAEVKRAPAPKPTEHWAIAEGYEGIEHAQLVVVNVRMDGQRADAGRVVEDLGRVRKDQAVFDDILGYRGNKLPITAVVADLSAPKDPGLKKAITRVKRAIKARRG